MVKIKALRKLLKKKYTDIEKIGSGASGIVYKGKNISTGKMEAIKCITLPEENPQSPDKEINILNQCNHPNIVRIYNSFTRSNDSIDVLFITMELCEEDLQELLSKKMGNPLRDIEYRKIFRELVAGVKYLHDNKIIHRDLKPHNIFFHHGVTKIGDFGIAKILNTQILIGTKSKLYGSSNYMAPERFNDSAPSGKVDVWSLGCILYELIEGKLAFPGDNIDEVYPKLIQCKYPKPLKAKQPELDIILRTIAPEAKRMDINELFNLTNTGITTEYNEGFIELQDMGAHKQEEYKFDPIKIQEPVHHFKPIAPLFTYKKKNEIKYSKCVVHKKLVL